jgi:hypothetical protein
MVPLRTSLEADDRAAQAVSPEHCQRTAQELDGVTVMSFSPLTRRLAIAAVGVTALSALLNGAESLLHAAPGSPLAAVARVFDVVSDGTAPTWYSSFLLLFAAALMLQIVRWSEASSGTTNYRTHLIVLATGLVYMSIDETARIHEQLNDPLRNWLNLGGAFEYAWVVVAISLIAAIGIMYFPWIVSLPAHVRNLVVTGGVVFSVGAVGLEMVGAAFLYGQNATRLAGLIAHGEELAEMLGVIIFVEAMIRHLADLAWDGALRFDITSPTTRLSEPDAQASYDY